MKHDIEEEAKKIIFKGFSRLVRAGLKNETNKGTDVAVGPVHRHGEVTLEMMYERNYFTGQTGFEICVSTLPRSEKGLLIENLCGDYQWYLFIVLLMWKFRAIYI